MEHNRTMSVLVLKAEDRSLRICDALAGSGVRAIRFLLECPQAVAHITVNDYETRERIESNLMENKIDFTYWNLAQFCEYTREVDSGNKDADLPKVVSASSDASQLLLASTGYDYIEIDPFGSPNTFLDAACKRISREGILAVTATDTSALAASYPDACERKYWATPCEGIRKHEVGLRILIRKVQLLGAQYEKALVPLLAYNKDHYYRIYFRCVKGKQRCDEILATQGHLEQEPQAGPLWTGPLCDTVFVEKMLENAPEGFKEFLLLLKEESSLPQPPLYHYLNDINRELELQGLASTNKEELLKFLGTNASRTHHDGAVIKSTKSQEEILTLLKER